MKILFLVISVLIFSMCPACSNRGVVEKAEDIWGNEVDLAGGNGLVVINPFSTSNCGYCLIDGDFVRENYCKRTIKYGGKFYYMCLFNPQIDIYSFMKHYRKHAPVLNYPPSLHSIHRDSFPMAIVLKN